MSMRARGARIEALRRRDVAQELDRVQVRIDAEVLGQVAELGAQPIGLAHDVDTIPRRFSARGPLDGGQDAHERGLAGSVGPEQPVDPWAQFHRELAQRLDARAVTLGQRVDRETHRDLRVGAVWRRGESTWMRSGARVG
jgi:hypothetical protein